VLIPKKTQHWKGVEEYCSVFFRYSDG